jgi:hypothetical protein
MSDPFDDIFSLAKEHGLILNKMRAQSPRFSHGVKRALFAPCK